METTLIGTRDPKLEGLLRACGLHVTTLAQGTLSELAHAPATQPALVVVDLRGVTAVPPTLAVIKRQNPSAGVLMVLQTLDASSVLQAMRAGANECVAEPLSSEDLVAAIGRIQAQQPTARKAQVFAVVGAKGGVGATTVAVNTAAALGKGRPGSTLLIDLHLAFGDAGVFLGAEPRFSVADAFENMHRLDAAVLKGLVASTPCGVHLLASSDRPAVSSATTAHVRALIELAASQYAFVVLDVPRTDAAVLDALDLSGTIAVVADQEVASVRGAARLSTLLQQRYGSRVRVVVTRYDERAAVGLRELERAVGARVHQSFPNDYEAAVTSQNTGRPVVLDSHTKLAASFTSFARSLAGLPQQAETERPGLFARIGGRR